MTRSVTSQNTTRHEGSKQVHTLQAVTVTAFNYPPHKIKVTWPLTNCLSVHIIYKWSASQSRFGLFSPPILARTCLSVLAHVPLHFQYIFHLNPSYHMNPTLALQITGNPIFLNLEICVPLHQNTDSSVHNTWNLQGISQIPIHIGMSTAACG